MAKIKMQVNKYDAELAALAQEDAGIESKTGLGSFISTKGGRLSYQDAEMPGNTLNAIVLGHIMENHYYDVDYDSDNPVSPVCYAFGKSLEEMAPHPDCSEPQHATCQGCPMNEFGTARKGKGKACANIRRLGLITEDSLEDVAGAEIAFLKVPVMSVKGWAGHVRQVVETLKKPVFGVVTEVSTVPDDKSMFRVTFKTAGEISDTQILGALIEKRKGLDEKLMQPYPETTEVEQPKAKSKPKFAGKARPVVPAKVQPKAKARR